MKTLGIIGIILGMIVLACVAPTFFGVAAILGGISLMSRR